MRAGELGPRSDLDLGLRSVGASLWFSLCFFVAFPLLILWSLGIDLRPPLGPRSVCGLLVILAAHAVGVAQIAQLVRRGRGTHAPFDPPRALVAAGLYRHVRNPLYWLYVVVILGEALVYGSWALLAYAGAFWLLEHVYVVTVEEKELARRFGEGYLAYARRVGRWLPRRPPAS